MLKFTRKTVSLILSVVLLLSVLSGCGSSKSSQGSETSTPKQNGDSAPAQAEAAKNPFYKGKTLQVIVPFGAGGGTDVFGRLLASYLGQHTEGTPAVQVINIPGGGSVNGANQFVSVLQHDGYSALLTSASTHAPYLLGDPAVMYDLKKMKPVLGLPTGGVVYTSPKTGISDPKSALNPKEKLIYAGISATGLDLVTLLSFEVLGMDVKAILGYDGRGPSRVAFEQGESNIDYQTSSAYIKSVEPLVKEGKAIPMYSFGQLDENGDIVRDPAFPDIPSLKEYYIAMNGKEPSGIEWEAYKAFVGSSFSVQKVIWLHSDDPQDAVLALSKAGAAVASDQDFNKKAEKELGGYTLVTGEKLEKMVASMLNVSDEVLEWVKNYLETEHGVKRLDKK